MCLLNVLTSCLKLIHQVHLQVPSEVLQQRELDRILYRPMLYSLVPLVYSCGAEIKEHGFIQNKNPTPNCSCD